MHAPAPSPADQAAHRLPLWEFIAMMASVTAVNALGIDMMLAALPEIGRSLRLAVENHQQLVISVYVGAFGIGQLIWGPLTDRYGRRAILLGAMAVYAAMSFLGAHAGSLELLLAARAMQGIAAASTRVLTTSIIRDCYHGRTMAKIMSRAYDRGHAIELVKAGADYQLRETFESALVFGGAATRLMGATEEEAAGAVERVREFDANRFELQVINGGAGQNLLISNADEQAREQGVTQADSSEDEPPADGPPADESETNEPA